MHTRSFDPNGCLKTHPVGSDTRTLTYDAASRITQTTDTNPVNNRSYDYDGLDRLISQSDNSGFKLWGYDANSNRTTAQFGGTGYPYTIASTSNRLTSAAGPVAKNYSYDAAGHPLSDGATTFTWNAAGKLATTVKSAKTHTYKTNALDQRISKNGPLSSKFFFFYDLAGQLIGEYRDNSSTATPADDWLVRQETIWLEDIPVAVIRKASATSPIQVYFIHADHLNTPRVIVNQSNTPVWRWENTHAFGANLPDENPDGNAQLFEYHPRFSGQYFDNETGLHYNYFRYYEPETGRYISPDPIGLAGGINTFGYVSGNPISKFDFFGLAEMCNVGFPMSFEIPHTFLCANGSCAGYYPSGNALFSDGELKNDTDRLKYSTATCSDVPQKNCTKEELDNCISNFVKKIGPIGDKYNFYANNCGQWATKVITYCRSQCDQ